MADEPSPETRGKRGCLGKVVGGLVALLLLVLGAAAFILYGPLDAVVRSAALPYLDEELGIRLDFETLELAPPLGPLTLEGVQVEIPANGLAVAMASLAADLPEGPARIEGIEVWSVEPETAVRREVAKLAGIEATWTLDGVTGSPPRVDDVAIRELVARVVLEPEARTNLDPILGRTGEEKAPEGEGPPGGDGSSGGEGAGEGPEGDPSGAEEPGEEVEGPSPLAEPLFALGHLALVDSELHYVDRMTGADSGDPAWTPTELAILDLDVDAREVQIGGAPVGPPLGDLRLDARIDHPTNPAQLGVVGWLGPWNERPDLSVRLALTGFDLRTVPAYVPPAGRSALGGSWVHADLVLDAEQARIRQGRFRLVVDETDLTAQARFEGDLFAPTIVTDDLLVNAFALPIAALLNLGGENVGAAVVELAGGVVDAAGALVEGVERAANTEEGDTQGFLGAILEGIGGFFTSAGEGVANAAGKIADTDGEFQTEDTRPPAVRERDFRSRHVSWNRSALGDRLAASKDRDPDRMPAIQSELAELLAGPRASRGGEGAGL